MFGSGGMRAWRGEIASRQSVIGYEANRPYHGRCYGEEAKGCCCACTEMEKSHQQNRGEAQWRADTKRHAEPCANEILCVGAMAAHGGGVNHLCGPLLGAHTTWCKSGLLLAGKDCGAGLRNTQARLSNMESMQFLAKAGSKTLGSLLALGCGAEDVRAQVVARDLAGGGIFDGAAKFWGHLEIAIQPCPDMALLYRPVWCGNGAGKSCLPFKDVDGSFEGRLFHGAEHTTLVVIVNNLSCLTVTTIVVNFRPWN